MAVGHLLVLHVFALAAVLEAEGPGVGGTLDARSGSGSSGLRDFGPSAERDREVLALTIASGLEHHLVAGLVALKDLGEVVVAENKLAIDGQNNVTGLQSCLGGRPSLDDLSQPRAGVGTVALNAKIARGDGLGHLRRFTHADLRAINNGENGFWVLAIPIEADPAELARRQAFTYLLKGL